MKYQHSFALISSLLSVVLLGACTSGTIPAKNTAASEDTCSSTPQRASSSVLAVVDAHLACSTDADCASVGIGGSCFDNCTRAVNQSGADAVRRAIERANTTECGGFAQKGCQLIHPPCAPPMAPSCQQGRCQ